MHSHDNEALRCAAENGHVEVVRILLAAGADLSVRKDFALKWAARCGHLEIVQLLLDGGANVHADNDYSLRMAADSGFALVVGALLDAGADISAFDHEALRAACVRGYTNIVHLLRGRGAPLEILIYGIQQLSPAVQIAALCTGDLGGFSVSEVARHNACPEALCALLAHQGHAELAAMLTATQRLEPMAPDARAVLLPDLLPNTHQEPAYVGV